MNRSKLIQVSFLLTSIAVFFSSCEIIGGIFKAGVWVGVLAIVGIVALILYFVGRGKK